MSVVKKLNRNIIIIKCIRSCMLFAFKSLVFVVPYVLLRGQLQSTFGFDCAIKCSNPSQDTSQPTKLFTFLWGGGVRCSSSDRKEMSSYHHEAASVSIKYVNLFPLYGTIVIVLGKIIK